MINTTTARKRRLGVVWLGLGLLAVGLLLTAVPSDPATTARADHKQGHSKGGGGGGGGEGGDANFAFVYVQSGLRLTTIDGATTTRLTSLGSADHDVSPAWSPDLDPDSPGYQGQIAFERHDGDDTYLCVVNPDGSGLRVVETFHLNDGISPFPSSSLAGKHGATLAWSPSAREIVFYGRITDDEGDALEQGLYAVDVDFGGWRWIGGGFDPAISAARSQIAYWDPDEGIYVVDFTLDEFGYLDVDHTTTTLVAYPFGGAKWPAWSPDGLFLACIAFARRLEVIEMQDFTRMVVFSDSDPNLYHSKPTWSPDGLQIGFNMQFVGNGGWFEHDLFRITDWWDPDNRQVWQVTNTKNKAEQEPDWSPGWIAP